MDKKKIIKKAMKASGKGGPMDSIKGAVKKAGSMAIGAGKGAADAFKKSLASDKKNMGFRDPGSIVSAGIKGVLGGVVGAAKAAQKSPLSVPPLSKAAPTKLPSISQGALTRSMPKPITPRLIPQAPARTSVPLKAKTSMPLPKMPKSMPAKARPANQAEIEAGIKAKLKAKAGKK